MKSLIIFGQPNDPHIARVCSLLNNDGVLTGIYTPISDTRLSPDPVSWFDSRAGVKSTLILPDLSGGYAECDPSASVWWIRNKFQTLGILTETDQRHHFEVNTREAFVRGLISASKARSINGNRMRKELNRKIHQLSLAQSLAFPIPKTIISSSRQEILNFLNQAEATIIKTLDETGAPPITNGDENPMLTNIFIMTNDISAEEVMLAHDDEFLSAPMIVQEKIDKKYELRIIAFGSDAICYKIESQNNDKTLTDWRHGESNSDMFSISDKDLTFHIRGFIKNYLASLELDMGVFDFAVDKSEKVIFFECNPSGQWCSIEGTSEYPVSSMIAHNMLEILSEPN